MSIPLESWKAKTEAPFVVIGVRTIGERLVRSEYLPHRVALLKPQTAFAREVCRQLKAYVKEPNFQLDLPFDFSGTDIQTRVWKAVQAIPVGAVHSFLQVIRKIGSAPRPVGTACGANHIPILIPCHRVVGSQGIGGFIKARRGVSIDAKRWLLHHKNPGAC